MTRMSFDGSAKRRNRRHHHHKRVSMPPLGFGYKSWIGIVVIGVLFAILLYLAWRS